MNNESDFEKLYNELYSIHYNKLNKLRKKANNPQSYLSLLIIISIIGLIIFRFKYPILTIIFVFIIIVINGIKYSLNEKNDNKYYISYYKENIIKRIINSIFKGSTITYENIKNDEIMKEYDICNWEKYNYFFTFDKIETTILNKELKMYSIKTQYINSEHKNITNFRGIYGFVKLDNTINKKIKIILKRTLFKKKSIEFNKIYNTETTIDESVQKYFVDLFNKYKNKIDLCIQDNKIHFRITLPNEGQPFEVKLFKNISKQELKEIYTLLTIIKEVLTFNINYIENKNKH